MNTIYLDRLGERVNEDQVESSGNYSKVIIDSANNNWLLAFHYSDGNLLFTTHYVYSTTELNALVASNTDIVITHRYNSSDYKVDESAVYENSILTHKWLTVSNQMDSVICSEEYKLPSNIPDYSKTIKRSFDSVENLAYEFHYDAAGNCVWIVDGEDPGGDVNPSKICAILPVGFSWTDYPYYKKAFPTIPSELV